MPKILGVHGIANTYLTAPQLRSAWFDAVQGGIEEAGYPGIAPEDLTVVAYGSLFRPDGTRGTRDRVDIEADWEKGLLESWWRAAAQLSSESRALRGKDDSAEDPGIESPEFSGRARTPAFVQSALRQLSKSRYFRAIGPSILISELRQVRLFLSDAAFKEAILKRFAAKMTPEIRVVIGHSLGSVVAYEALCTDHPWRVDTLVTVGSPLGIRNVVFDLLTPKPVNDRGERPKARRWVNISDRGDLVALEKELAPLFDGVEDIPVHNGWRSHDVLHYLTAAETGKAVALGLKSTAR